MLELGLTGCYRFSSKILIFYHFFITPNVFCVQYPISSISFVVIINIEIIILAGYSIISFRRTDTVKRMKIRHNEKSHNVRFYDGGKQSKWYSVLTKATRRHKKMAVVVKLLFSK